MKVHRVGSRKPEKGTSKDWILERVKPLNIETHGMRFTVYGKMGTGKTTFWSTFPAPILGIICTGGKGSGELRSIDTEENRKRIKTIEVESSSEVVELVEELRGKSHGFKTVAVDHVTGLQDMILGEILGLDEVPETKEWGTATFQEYGQCTAQTKRVLSAILSLRLDTVMVCQERNFNTKEEILSRNPDDEDSIQTTVGPGLMPKLAAWICTESDYVVQTYKREGRRTRKIKKKDGTVKAIHELTGEIEYAMRVGPSTVYETRSRVPNPKLPKSIVNPTFSQFLDILEACRNG